MATKWTTTRAAEKQQKLVRCVAVADVDVAAVSGQQQQRSSSNIAAAATSERQQQSWLGKCACQHYRLDHLVNFICKRWAAGRWRGRCKVGGKRGAKVGGKRGQGNGEVGGEMKGVLGGQTYSQHSKCCQLYGIYKHNYISFFAGFSFLPLLLLLLHHPLSQLQLALALPLAFTEKRRLEVVWRWWVNCWPSAQLICIAWPADLAKHKSAMWADLSWVNIYINRMAIFKLIRWWVGDN